MSLLRRYILVALVGLVGLLPLAGQDAPVLRLTQRYRVQPVPNQDMFEVRNKEVAWSARTMAVIVCDVWDSHHCLNAVRREEEMVPRIDRKSVV